jgi:hypothetical protein
MKYELNLLAVEHVQGLLDSLIWGKGISVVKYKTQMCRWKHSDLCRYFYHMMKVLYTI